MYTILLLDDEALLMSLLVRMLKYYTVIEAATAEQALRQFNDHERRIDLLIADVTLPPAREYRWLSSCAPSSAPYPSS